MAQFLSFFSIRAYTLLLLLSLAILVMVFENIEVIAQRGPGPPPHFQPAPLGESRLDVPTSNLTSPPGLSVMESPSPNSTINSSAIP
jgi:hypothetical protein